MAEIIDEKARYYDEGGIEVLDIIKAKMTAEQYRGFLLVNIIKYSCRLNHKGCESSDARKISVYSELLAKEMEE